mgnify:CR=1 FL=1
MLENFSTTKSTVNLKSEVSPSQRILETSFDIFFGHFSELGTFELDDEMLGFLEF